MKILVADDEVVARKVLGAFLKQSGYEMVVVEDAASAFRLMTAPDAPSVAILDWMMPDRSGPELCRDLRRHPFAIQPYLLMLSGRKNPADIAEALDAGADDFITKPFNIAETQARLRVARRAVERQIALHRRIADLEAKSAMQQVPPPPSTSEAATAPATPVLALDRHQLDAVVAGALRHCGICDAPRRHSRQAQGMQPIGWAGLLLPKRGVWIDVTIEAAPLDLPALFTTAHRRPPTSPAESACFAASLQTAVRDSMHSVWRAMGEDVLLALPPRAVTEPPPPGASAETVETHRYRIAGVPFSVVIALQRNPVRPRETFQLQLLDILAQPYPPADRQRIPLLRSGVVLTEHYLEKLRHFAASAPGEVPPVLVHTPSALALHYCRDGLAVSTGATR